MQRSNVKFRIEVGDFVGNVSSTVFLAISAIIMVRLLGPDSYGVYTWCC